LEVIEVVESHLAYVFVVEKIALAVVLIKLRHTSKIKFGKNKKNFGLNKSI
jgi:hypothetical protein